MRKLFIQIAAPLIVFPYIVGMGPSAVNAQMVGPLAATELLAKSYASNLQCNFLSAAEGDELGSYVARAEVALSEQVGVAQTKAALTRGKSAGRLSACSTSEKMAVTQTLVAARSAIAALATTSQSSGFGAREEPDPLPMLAAQRPQKSSKRKLKEPDPQFGKLVTTKKLSGNLSAYHSIAQKYYLARRCQTMSQGKIAKFYQTVVATHKNTIATFGVSAVAAAMRRAESSANSQRCT